MTYCERRHARVHARDFSSRSGFPFLRRYMKNHVVDYENLFTRYMCIYTFKPMFLQDLHMRVGMRELYKERLSVARLSIKNFESNIAEEYWWFSNWTVIARWNTQGSESRTRMKLILLARIKQASIISATR